MHAHAEDLAVLAQGELALQVDVASEARGDEVAGAILDPLDRVLGEDGRQDRDHVAGVDGHLVTEAAAQIGRDDPDHLLGELGHHRDRRTDDVRGLRRHVDGELARGAVVVGNRAAGLQRGRVRPRVVQVDRRDDVGLGEGAIRGLLVADLPVEDLVGGLVDLVVTDERRVRGCGLHGVDDRGQLLVLHHDAAGGILGDVGVVRDHRGDLLALETHLVGGHDRLGVVGQRRHPGEVSSGEGLPRHDEAYAGHLPGGTRVDRLDAGVSDRAAQDLHVEHAGKHDVVDVLALAANEAVVLDATATRAHPADLELVQRHVVSYCSRIFSAAQRTAFTMFW